MIYPNLISGFYFDLACVGGLIVLGMVGVFIYSLLRMATFVERWEEDERVGRVDPVWAELDEGE